MPTIIDGTLGVTTETGTGDVSVGDDLLFTGTGNRITGNFSNATLANRTIFQTSTTNGATNLIAITNGTGLNSSFNFYNNSDPTNAGGLTVGVLGSGTEASIRSSITGTGTYLPMTFYTGGSERVRITTNGGVSFGSSGTAYGTAGQVLQSNGDAAPSWATMASGFTNMQVYTSGSGTWTIPAGVTACRITVVGGGGGGGGTITSTWCAGGGGGAGGAAIRYYTGLTPGNTINYSVGGGGGGGGTGGTGTGSAGGTSSVSSGTQTITTISATGGSGGGNATGSRNGGAGGSGSGGTINQTGGTGFSANGSAGNNQYLIATFGGVSLFGAGGFFNSSTGNGSQSASNFGSGGSGALNANGGNGATGGAGAGGVVIIEY